MNKEKYLQRQKEYQKRNAEKLREYNKLYYEYVTRPNKGFKRRNMKRNLTRNLARNYIKRDVIKENMNNDHENLMNIKLFE